MKNSTVAGESRSTDTVERSAYARSEASPPPPQRRKSGPKLVEAQRRAIVAEVLNGRTQAEVAKAFNVNINTVATLVKSVKNVPESSLSPAWRERFEKLPELCVDAIERSVKDTKDLHSAARTAQTHMKGVGIYQPDNAVTNNVFLTQISSLPADWQAEYETAIGNEQATIDLDNAQVQTVQQDSE